MGLWRAPLPPFPPALLICAACAKQLLPHHRLWAATRVFTGSEPHLGAAVGALGEPVGQWGRARVWRLRPFGERARPKGRAQRRMPQRQATQPLPAHSAPKHFRLARPWVGIAGAARKRAVPLAQSARRTRIGGVRARMMRPSGARGKRRGVGSSDPQGRPPARATRRARRRAMRRARKRARRRARRITLW